MQMFLDVLKEVLVALLLVLGVTTPGLAASTEANVPTDLAAPSSGVMYPVVKVVDGDTITIDVDGHKQTVRLIGINTPETVDPRKPVECFGKEASDKAKALLTNHSVRVELDASQGTYDKYHRLLAYVYRDDELFVNKLMVSDGYAYEYTYNVPYEYQKEFKEAQRIAQNEDRGLWSPDKCDKK